VKILCHLPRDYHQKKPSNDWNYGNLPRQMDSDFKSYDYSDTGTSSYQGIGSSAAVCSSDTAPQTIESSYTEPTLHGSTPIPPWPGRIVDNRFNDGFITSFAFWAWVSALIAVAQFIVV
jgi:hypothetical protein